METYTEKKSKNKRLRSPIRWYGGKGHFVSKLLKLIPPHNVYVEVFGGGASLLFAKEPSSAEVYNDLDGGLVNFFRMLRDEEKFEKFYRKLMLTPYSREEFEYCCKTWQDCEDEIERAFRWYVVARGSFSGCFANSWSFAVRGSNKKMIITTSQWLSIIEMLPEIHQRIMSVQIEHLDFRKLIPTYDSPETFMYCDPPYILETRRCKSYKHEMTIEDHKELVDILLKSKSKFILSGYRHEIYIPLENAGWERKDYETACSATGRTRRTGILGKGSALKKQPRIESVWISPNCSNNDCLWKGGEVNVEVKDRND